MTRVVLGGLCGLILAGLLDWIVFGMLTAEPVPPLCPAGYEAPTVMVVPGWRT